MVTQPPEPSINLLRGWPNPSLLPISQMLAASQIAFSNMSTATDGMLYGPDDGYLPLRQEISKWLSSFYDSPDEVDRICVTGGASQNLACILQVFTDPSVTRCVWMVAPCYFLACRIFEDAGFAGRLRAVPEDAEGIDVGYLEREIERLPKRKISDIGMKPPRLWSKIYEHIIYAVPDFSNPSGKTMSLQRREQLVSLARTHNALVVTDDVYDRLQWPASSSPEQEARYMSKALFPRLSDIDRNLPPHPSDPRHFGHTVSNGSFSKILGPGLRTGWVDAAPVFSYGLSQCGSSRSGGCPSQVQATIVAELMRNGSLHEHIHSVLLPSYSRRWLKTMSAIEQYLVPLGISVSKTSLQGKDVFGGYFVWLELPKAMSAEPVAARAKEHENLVVAHGNLFEVYGDEEAVKFHKQIRVCFAWEDEDMLVEGIKRLGNAIKGMPKGGDGVRRENTTEGLRAPIGGF